MVDVLIAAAVIFGVLAGWVAVQQAYRVFASRNPMLAPFRGEDGGCGDGGCACSGGQCGRRR